MKEIPFADQERFQNMFRTAEVPPAVAEAYWEYKRYHDVLDGGKPLETTELCFIAFISGRRGIPLPDKEASPFETLTPEFIGRKVLVKFGRKESEGELVALNKSSVVVKLDGEQNEREFEADKVLRA